MKTTFNLLAALLLAPLAALHAADVPKLKPILGTRGDVIFSDSFDGPMKPEWQPLMKTRFAIADGTLDGQPATAEDQAKAHDEKHDGRSPAIQLKVIRFSFWPRFRSARARHRRGAR
jgi:hypothetical protein